MIIPKVISDKYLGEPLSQYNVEDVPQDLDVDFGDIDFESSDELSEIDFESDKPIAFDFKFEPEMEGVYEGLIKPTAKALVKVPVSVLSSIALLPGAGIASLIELMPKISPDPKS